MQCSEGEGKRSKEGEVCSVPEGRGGGEGKVFLSSLEEQRRELCGPQHQKTSKQGDGKTQHMVLL